MKIEILGSGCSKCKKLEENAREAIKKFNQPIEVEKVTDIQKIVEMGIMFTPALAIDGVLKSSGKVLSVKEIEQIISGGK